MPAARDPTGPGTWRPKPPARLFFVAVYIFGVLVCLNIVVAFALDSFNQVLAETKAEKGEAERRLLEDCDGSGGAAEGQGEEGEGGPRVGPRSRFSVHSASISAAQRQFRVSIPAALHVSGLRADTKKALLEIGPADRSDRAPKRPQGDLGQGKRSPPLPPPDDGVELSGPRSEDPAHVDADAAWAGNNGSGSSSDGEGARAHTPDE